MIRFSRRFTVYKFQFCLPITNFNFYILLYGTLWDLLHVTLSKSPIKTLPKRLFIINTYNYIYKYKPKTLRHDSSLKPGITPLSQISNGRLTSIPSVERSLSCSSSVMDGNFSDIFCSRYKIPLVLKNFFNGSPLFL